MADAAADPAAAAVWGTTPEAEAPTDADMAPAAAAAGEEPAGAGAELAPLAADWVFPVYVGHRRYLSPDATMFETANEERSEMGRAAAVSVIKDGRALLAKEATLAGKDLANYLSHKFECATCHASLPTAHLLSCHISELHDSFFAAQAARRMRVYCCLVEGCVRKFCTVEERKQHLTDLHRFPRNYAFDRIHLRRKKAQIRPLPQYRKAAPPADAFEGLVGKLGAEEEGSPAAAGGEGPAAGPAGAAGSAEKAHKEVLAGLGALSVAAREAPVPAHVSFGRHLAGRGMPGAGRARGAGGPGVRPLGPPRAGSAGDNGAEAGAPAGDGTC